MTDPASRHTIPRSTPDELRGMLNGQYALLPYQGRWVGDDSKVKIADKGRRIGLSWSEAGDDALYSAREDGADCYYLGYNKEMSMQFAEDVEFWAKWYNLACSQITGETIMDGAHAVQKYTVRFKSGNEVQCLSGNPRNLRSKGGRGERVVLDEFAWMEDPQAALKAAMAFLVWGDSVRIISTHNGAENPFAELIAQCREGRFDYSIHRTTFRDAIEEGLYRRICLMRGEEWTKEAEEAWVDEIYAFYGEHAAEELDCVPSRSGGRYLPRLIVEDAMEADIPVLRWRWEPEWRLWTDERTDKAIAEYCREHVDPLLADLEQRLACCVGFDFGRYIDLSVLGLSQIQENLIRRYIFALELRDVPFRAQRGITKWIIDKLPRFRCGAFDAGGNGLYMAEEMTRLYGPSRIHSVHLSNQFCLEHWPRYKAALEDSRVILPKDAEILDDHSAVKMLHGVPRVPRDERRTTGKGKERGQRHGDAAVACMLNWYASEQNAGDIEFVSSGTPATRQHGYMDGLAADSGHRALDTGFGAAGRRRKYTHGFSL